MELWMNLLFGNAVGLMSMIVMFATLGIFVFIIRMYFVKSAEKPQEQKKSEHSDSDGNNKV